MKRKTRRWVWALAFAGWVGSPAGVRAQAPPAGSATNAAMMNSAMSPNPYMNAYSNPFLNPYMTQAPLQGNPLFLYMAAQNANGGIGSGRISGTRPAPAAAAPAAAVEDQRRGTDVPGAGAARYFNRGQKTSSAAVQYYNRKTRSYPSNHH